MCGFINLTDAKIRRFGDIISEFWIKSNFSCCKWFFFDPKIYINQVVAFCELFLSFFLFEVLLVSALNVSFGFVLKNIKISIEPFFESQKVKVVWKDFLRKWTAIFAFPFRRFSLQNDIFKCFHCRHGTWQSKYFIRQLYLYSCVDSNKLCWLQQNAFGRKYFKSASISICFLDLIVCFKYYFSLQIT